MALSKNRTCLARLRALTPYGMRGFGEMIGRSVDWMKKTESGKLPLTAETIQQISHATGVSSQWLADGDPGKPIVTLKGAPYTADFFDWWRMRLESNDAPRKVVVNVASWAIRIAGVASAAGDDGALALLVWKLKRALDDLEKQFGRDPKAEVIVHKAFLDAGLRETIMVHDAGLDANRAVQDAHAMLRITQSPRSSRRPRRKA